MVTLAGHNENRAVRRALATLYVPQRSPFVGEVILGDVILEAYLCEITGFPGKDFARSTMVWSLSRLFVLVYAVAVTCMVEWTKAVGLATDCEEP